MTAPRRISELELHALVDGELTGEERAEVEALLAASPTEQALARGRDRLRSLMDYDGDKNGRAALRRVK